MKIREFLADPKVWTKGMQHEVITTRDGITHKYCIMGAIKECYPDPQDGATVFNALAEGIQGFYGSFSTMAGWNDHPDRTHEEVIDLVTKLDL